jgi:hypothetical protein
MVEILAGDGIENAFKDLGINARNTYKRAMPADDGMYHGEAYEVWELSSEDYERLCNISDDDEDDENWKEEWGWWRSAEGSNMGDVEDEFIINGQKIMAWRGGHREDLSQEWENESEEEKESYKDYDEYEETWCPHTYKDLLDYFCDEIGASTETNVCALATDLAEQNNMTMGELFTKLL